MHTCSDVHDNYAVGGIQILNVIKTEKKTGQEPFIFNEKNLPENVLSFWQWSSSELAGNALRGVLAEFIVASAIDSLKKPREEWDAYDLVTKQGLKIEVKSSAYLQSWQQEKLSKISFGIKPTGTSQIRDAKRTRKSDVYIFCVLSHKDKPTINPLNLNQWDFYILSTLVLNEQMSKQQSITLSSLLKLNPVHVKYDRLSLEINKQKNLPVQPSH